MTATSAVGRIKIPIFVTDFYDLFERIQLVLVELISKHLRLLISSLSIFYKDGGLMGHGFLSLQLLPALWLLLVFWQITVEKLTFEVLK